MCLNIGFYPCYIRKLTIHYQFSQFVSSSYKSLGIRIILRIKMLVKVGPELFYRALLKIMDVIKCKGYNTTTQQIYCQSYV